MAAHVLIAGGGIAGLASALALAHRRHRIDLLEQSVAFGEVGAGIQLGPNVTRRLQALGVSEGLMRVAARPEALVVRSATAGNEIARLPLGNAMLHNYAAPYLCVHRADLHALLLAAVRGSGAVTLTTGARVTQVTARGDAVCAASSDSRVWEADALIGADGLWSTVRPSIIEDASPPRATGHTAWRAMLDQSTLPAALRRTRVDVWLGPRLHAVCYPVRRGPRPKAMHATGIDRRALPPCSKRPAAFAVNCRPCSKPYLHGAHGRSTTGHRFRGRIRWPASASR